MKSRGKGNKRKGRERREKEGKETTTQYLEKPA
jgi:hypothetical protein